MRIQAGRVSPVECLIACTTTAQYRLFDLLSETRRGAEGGDALGVPPLLSFG